MPGATVVAEKDDPLSFTVSGGEREEATINIHRLWTFCQNNNPADCEQAIGEFVERISVSPPPVTPASLRLIVRDKQYVDYLRAPPGGRPDQAMPITARPIGADLYAILASDSEKATALITADGLSKLGMSAETAWTLAAKQTKAALPPIPDAAQIKQSGVAMEGFSYLPSLLIDVEGWKEVARAAGPDLFVTIVSDGFLFAGYLPDGERLDHFRKSVEEDCLQQPRCVSPNVYRFRDGQWIVAR